ncbi:MAG: Fe-S cluster assembly protein SufD [Pirellulaceae bacterium]
MTIDMATPVEFTSAGFEAFLDSRTEPAWLTDLRRQAWRQFETQDWPASNQEEWLRTDLRPFKLARFGVALGAMPHVDVAGLLTAGVQLGGHSVAVNGQPLTAHLSERWRQRGVLFGTLDEMVVEHGDLLRPFLLNRASDPWRDRFAALHTAFWSGGHVLYVPRGVVVSEPVHALSVIADGGSDLAHTLVVLEEGAEATVLSETASPTEDTQGFHCGSIQLLLRPGSNLRYVNLQNWGMGVWHFAHQKAIVQRDATLQWTLGAMGAKLAKVDQHVVLAEPGASCQVNGTMFTEGRQHLTYNTLQHHAAPQCRSDFLYKAALQDRSRTVWRGMIKVDPGAVKTDGYQRNDNLLLSSASRADSIPGLEIQADDVRCTHGATSGRVDEELIFYARCRGFTRQEAIRMIVTGFFQQVYDRITIESVREALGNAIARRVREYA